MTGQVALVAGATRCAGRAIAVELARAGAYVYATGRSSRTTGRSEIDRPETIEETGDLLTSMKAFDLSRLASELAGVTPRHRAGLLSWRYDGRLVARQLDDTQVVIRCSFDARDQLFRSFPETFTVLTRFARHMMTWEMSCRRQPSRMVGSTSTSATTGRSSTSSSRGAGPATPW